MGRKRRGPAVVGVAARAHHPRDRPGPLRSAAWRRRCRPDQRSHGDRADRPGLRARQMARSLRAHPPRDAQGTGLRSAEGRNPCGGRALRCGTLEDRQDRARHAAGRGTGPDCRALRGGVVLGAAQGAAGAQPAQAVRGAPSDLAPRSRPTIPPNDPDVLARLHAVEKLVSGSAIKYDAARDESGHGDLFRAVALAADGRAGSGAGAGGWCAAEVLR